MQERNIGLYRGMMARVLWCPVLRERGPCCGQAAKKCMQATQQAALSAGGWSWWCASQARILGHEAAMVCQGWRPPAALHPSHLSAGSARVGQHHLGRASSASLDLHGAGDA